MPLSRWPATKAYVDELMVVGVMITNVSIPDYPIVLKTITNGTDGYTKVHHPTSITTATIGSSTYALVTSASSDTSASLASLGGYSQTISRDDGVQIIDITNPSNPTAVSSITDGVDGFTELKGAASIITMTLNWLINVCLGGI